jgi:hypothetical protein
VWYVDEAGKVGRLDRSGQLTESSTGYPTNASGALSEGPWIGYDGIFIWVTLAATNAHAAPTFLGRVDPTSGAVTAFPSSPCAFMTTGPGHSVWCSTPGGLSLVEPDGALTTVALGEQPSLFTFMPSGEFWYQGAGGVFAVSPIVGAKPRTVVSGNSGGRWALAGGSDGALWGGGLTGLSRTSADGHVTDLPLAGTIFLGLASMPFGDLWVTQGLSTSAIVRVVPDVPPVLGAATADAIGPSAATATGTIDPRGNATSVRVEYGKTKTYDRTTAPVDVGDGVDVTPFSITVSDLEPSSTYHYRVVGRNVAGETSSLDATFTTPAGPPAAPGATCTSGCAPGASPGGPGPVAGACAPRCATPRTLEEPALGWLTRATRRADRRRLGRLLGVTLFKGLPADSRLMLRCVQACRGTLRLDAAAGNRRDTRRFRHALTLTTASRLEVALTRKGWIGRWATYSFRRSAGAVVSRQVAHGCLSASAAKHVACP